MTNGPLVKHNIIHRQMDKIKTYDSPLSTTRESNTHAAKEQHKTKRI